MENSTKTYKCPNCSGNLEWSPSDQKLKCPYCDSQFDLSAFEKQEMEARQEVEQNTYQHGRSGEEQGYDSVKDATDDSNIDPHDLRVYKCSVCGAEVVTDKTTMATNCAFCGNPVVLTEQMDTRFKPKYIVPFHVGRDKVKELYKKYVNTRPFTPKAFASEETADKVKAVYVPFWLYRMNMVGEIHATAERTSRREDSKYVYTTHRVFDVYRSGSLSLDKLPVDASSKTPDAAMDSIEPFDYSKMVPFKMAYMAGFLAERYDQDQNFCHQRALKRADYSMEKSLKDTIHGYSTVTVTNRRINEINEPVMAEYALLPVYLLTKKYRGKNYLFAINGQSGKIVGDVPVDFFKAAVRWGIMAVIIFVVSVVILFFI